MTAKIPSTPQQNVKLIKEKKMLTFILSAMRTINWTIHIYLSEHKYLQFQELC